MRELRTAIAASPMEARSESEGIMRRYLDDHDFLREVIDVGAFQPEFGRSLLHRDPSNMFSLWLFYWRPMSESPPHLHRNWTVSAVIYNTLTVRVYETIGELDAPNGLRVIRETGAAAGVVRSLIPPCIHSVGNPTDLPTLSINLYGPMLSQPDTTWFGEIEKRPDDPDRPLKVWTTGLALRSLFGEL